MARFAYFADLADGTTVEFRDSVQRYQQGMYERTRIVPAKVWHEGRKVFGYATDGSKVEITRTVQITGHDKHECDARCRHAKGRTMHCECACGGKNHGKGN